MNNAIFTYNFSHASNLKVEFGLPSSSLCKKTQWQVNWCCCFVRRFLQYVSFWNRRPPIKISSLPSLVTHQKARLFLLPSPIPRIDRRFALFSFSIRDSSVFLASLGYPRKKGFTRETKLKDGPEWVMSWWMYRCHFFTEHTLTHPCI
jgi:hypothetical protein